MGNFNIVCVAVWLACLIVIATSAQSDCPISTKVTSCNPKCKSETECHGQKCCKNICGTLSCLPHHLDDKKGEGYKNQKNGGTGNYCGNVKCSAFEKCEMDRSTKREKCVRG